MIHLPKGNPVRQKVNPARVNLPEAMEKLRKGTFSGYLRFDAPQGVGIILFQSGRLISSLYVSADESERLIAYDAIAKVFENSILGHSVLNIFKLSADLALSLHALLHGHYLLKGELLKELDVRSQLEKVQEQGLTCCLRVYNGEQTTLIFYDEGYALGFFHDGTTDLETTADLDRSVACAADAKLDILEIRSADDLVLADLMGSADLGPIWRRTRKILMEERRKREEESIRRLDADNEKRRQHVANIFKTIAGNHIGKFGVTQVEKAFNVVGPEMRPTDMEHFYLEMQRLARLVAGQSKIDDMINEMKRQFES